MHLPQALEQTGVAAHSTDHVRGVFAVCVYAPVALAPVLLPSPALATVLHDTACQ